MRIKITGFVVACAMFLSAVPTHAQTATHESLLALIAQLQAQIAALGGGNTNQLPLNTLTANLTVGSTGPEVVTLQQFLVSKGYLTMPIGVAMGTFGPLTRSALASYQAANNISPAVGYFGPITRTHVNQAIVTAPPTTPPSTPPSNGGQLGNSEASLRSFSLQGEESRGNERESDVEIATAEFDVESGDVRVERFVIDFQAENMSDSVRPWDYFESISLVVNGRTLDEMDVDRRADWDQDRADSEHSASNADWYRITFTGLDHTVRRGQTAQITIVATMASNIDSADLTQEFTISIPDNGIRARDGLGIQHYIGDDNDTVSGFGFGKEESGDLDINSHRDDPDSFILISDEDRKSDDYTVFVFEIENRDDVDVEMREITIAVEVTGGTLSNILDQAILIAGNHEFRGDINSAEGTITFDDMELEIDGDDEETFELEIVLKRNAPDSTLKFSVASEDIEAEGVVSGDDSTISGAVSSEEHTVARLGIEVTGVSKGSSVGNEDTVGTFHITFNIKALGDDVYIHKGASDAAFASTSGMFYNIYRSGALETATTTDSAVVQSSADQVGEGNSWYVIREGRTESFTLTATLSPDTDVSALYYIELDSIRFDDDFATTADDTAYKLPNSSEFETTPVSIK